MKDVKNDNGKLVARVDEAKKVVEIVSKGFKTVLSFKPCGQVVVDNSKIAV